MTFRNGEENKLEDVIENTKPKLIWPTRNHPPKLWCIKIELETSWKPIWDPTKDKVFWYHETIVTNPHARKKKIDQL
jgi:hypothetical protein